MKVLVCGGRGYTGTGHVFSVLDDMHRLEPITLIIHGASGKTDFNADEWARRNVVPCLRVPADWKQHGSSAGPIRNRQMLKAKPALVVAFPGGAGTADMIAAAQAAKVPVRIEDAP